ncbi:MAG: hypothetical protein KKG92_15365 [Gammaproteobacteria bacterium]|nr:hypothetical protein [Gammaproteobacteria bacterium]
MNTVTRPTPPHYERFSRSHHWLPTATQAAAPVPPGAAFARACAGAIVRYWEIGLAAGGIDPTREVVVLEPEAAGGQFTWQMLDALRERLADSLCAGLQMRYIACAADSARADTLLRHLASRVREGVLDVAVWQSGRDCPESRGHGGPVDLSGNPPVILAQRYFGGLVQELFRRRRGHLFEGLLAQRARGERLAYRWRGINAADWLPAAWRAVLAPADDAAPSLFPSGALRSLDHLARLAHRRYLLLAVDEDAAAAPLPRAWPANRHLPIDFACLAAYQASLGAQVWNGRPGQDGLRVQAILRDDRNPARQGTLAAVVACLRESAPDDHLHLAAILRDGGHALPPARILALLRLSGFDPLVLEAGIDVLAATAATWNEALKQTGRAALVRVWANHLSRAGQGPLGPRLADLAQALGYWGLAKSVLRMEAAMRAQPGVAPASPPASFDDAAARTQPAACLLQLARCEAETGATREALAHTEVALRGAPPAALARELTTLHDRLAASLRAWADLPWYRPELAQDGDIRIEPGSLEAAPAGEPAALLLLHECWGRLGTAEFRVADGSAWFRLQFDCDHGNEDDMAAVLRLFARLARAAGAGHCEVEMARRGKTTAHFVQPTGERDESVQETYGIHPERAGRPEIQNAGGGGTSPRAGARPAR